MIILASVQGKLDVATRPGRRERVRQLTTFYRLIMRLRPRGLIPKRPKEWRRRQSPEFSAHSFIVKVWIEEEINKHGNPIWHGHITHVPDGEQRYLRNLGEIERFVAPYLSDLGIRFGLRERIRRWLCF